MNARLMRELSRLDVAGYVTFMVRDAIESGDGRVFDEARDFLAAHWSDR